MVWSVTNIATGVTSNFASEADIEHFFAGGANPANFTVTDSTIGASNAAAFATVEAEVVNTDGGLPANTQGSNIPQVQDGV